MMNGCGGCLAISPLISTSEPNITARLLIIALKMNYGKNIRSIQFSFKSISHSLLSVKGTLQTGGIGLLSICIQKKKSHHIALCFDQNLFYLPPWYDSARAAEKKKKREKKKRQNHLKWVLIADDDLTACEIQIPPVLEIWRNEERITTSRFTKQSCAIKDSTWATSRRVRRIAGTRSSYYA